MHPGSPAPPQHGFTQYCVALHVVDPQANGPSAGGSASLSVVASTMTRTSLPESPLVVLSLEPASVTSPVVSDPHAATTKAMVVAPRRKVNKEAKGRMARPREQRSCRESERPTLEKSVARAIAAMCHAAPTMAVVT